MQPNLTSKEVEDAYRRCGLYEDVIEGVVPKTEAELTAFITKYGCGDVSVGTDSAFIGVEARGLISVNFADKQETTFKSLPDAYVGIVLNGLPISKQIGKVRVKGFAII